MNLDFGINAGLVEELYAQYLDNPASVDPSWRTHFDARLAATTPARSLATRAGNLPVTDGDLARTLTAPRNGLADARSTEAGFQAGVDEAFDASALPEPPHGPPADPRAEHEQEVLAEAAIRARVYKLLNAYRVRGHLFAHIDPLGSPKFAAPELDFKNFDLLPEDLDKPFPTIDLAGLPPVATLREILSAVEETYCRTIGVEFTHVEDPEPREWLQQRMESTRNRLALAEDEQLRILTKLSDAEIFEQFIQRSYGAGTKRFSLEGAESLIPLLDLVIEQSALRDVEEIVIGMAHRGRLNVLANIMDKSVREIFAAFEDADPERFLGGGDVKYHLGYSTDRVTGGGKSVHLTMTFNPSHLEFVNPVAEGRARAKQDRLLSNDGVHAGVELAQSARAQATDRRRVLPLLIHGDAAFMGQGIVAETLNLTGLAGYATGGTIHVIVNNQVGFTTDPEDSRSTRYASDITRMLKVPVFHVNGEDPEAVAQVAHLATEFRQRFGLDIVIDMYCYRRHGHNEGDEPRYTQPLMYQAVDRKPTVRQVYVKRLVKMGNVTEDTADAIVVRRREALATALDDVKQRGFAPVTYAMGGVWTSYRGGPDGATPEVATAVPAARIRALSQRLVELPEGFHAHPKVTSILRARHAALMDDEPFDWGTGEMLAYATLLADRTPIRISGQDVRRGTFSHRHAVLFDTQSGEAFAPLAGLAAAPGRFEIYNSPLSEQGVLGFDFGYSLDYPEALVIWEAQFGDFLNGAQVIVDQFITSSEDKWHRLSGLVLYLPHGYEGQGPEHSSARVERFLQNAAEDNVQVCNLTTPAQLFHALRRQVLRPWRKPLVIMTPKSLLRVAATSSGPHRPVSRLSDLTEGRFHRVIADTAGVDPSRVRRVLLCSGKVYYDLALARDARKANDVAIVRLEQLYPLNEELTRALAAYPDGTPIVWVQEEPKNYGGWYYILATVPDFLHGRLPLSCVARASSASPATGSRASHLYEQKMLIDEAFS
jgi:2-oxoglutarate dehydrogenase E1 component